MLFQLNNRFIDFWLRRYLFSIHLVLNSSLFYSELILLSCQPIGICTCTEMVWKFERVIRAAIIWICEIISHPCEIHLLKSAIIFFSFLYIKWFNNFIEFSKLFASILHHTICFKIVYKTLGCLGNRSKMLQESPKFFCKTIQKCHVHDNNLATMRLWEPSYKSTNVICKKEDVE